jgi:AAA family ATP:ADP antiporter
LYIPTVKDLKFKSKSWIDAFGSKFAKSTGSAFNHLVSRLGSRLFMPAHAGLFAIVLGSWFVTAFLLGKRYDQALKNNEVIGREEEQVA